MYVEPTRQTVEALLARQLAGPVDMLNLLRFREVADYSAFPDLAPAAPISGAEAYERYAAHAMPFLRQAEASVVYLGQGGPPVIGPFEERWDRVLIVRHQSVQAFLAFAQNEGYLAGVGHRSAALLDSRLLPMVQG